MTRVFRVTNQAELKSALSKAAGGDVISLAGGNYGQLSLIDRLDVPSLDFASEVKIVSEDLKNPAIFEGLDLRGAHNLAIEGVVFDYVYKPGHQIWLNPFRISDSSGVAIRNSIFDGDLPEGLSKIDDGYGYAKGLTVRSSSGIEIKNNEFFSFHTAAAFGGVSNLIVSGNNVHSVRSDGFNFTSVRDVLIEANHLHDFIASHSSSDHRDMIQFWTTSSTSPSTDIVIRGNFLDIGKGDFTQSIFMRNEEVDLGNAGKEMFYRNILIENNVIQNNHTHGITVGETVGLVIRSNTLLRKESLTGPVLESSAPLINVTSDAEQVSIQKNIVGGINGHKGQSGWSLSQNAIVQHTNPEAPGWYGDIFIASTLYEPMTGAVLIPGSGPAVMGVGAPQTRGLDTPGLSGRIHVTDFDDDGALRIFDARFSAVGGRELPEGTVYLWSFHDGSQYMGPVIAYRFDGGGSFDVRLTVMTPGGRTDSVRHTIDVAGPKVLSFEAGKSFLAYDYGEPIALPKDEVLSEQGLVLGGEGASYWVGRDYVADIPGADDVKIDFSIRSASTSSAGEIFRLHESFIVGTQGDGDLYMDIFTADGQKVRMESSGIRLNDRAEHDVSIRLIDGKASIYIDGNLTAEAKMTDVIAGSGTRPLSFGDPWGKINFDGLLTRFSIEQDSSDFASTGEGLGYAVITADTLSDWSMLCTPTQTDKVGTKVFDTSAGDWVATSSSDDLVPMI